LIGLEGIVEDVIGEYQKYRSEAVARLISWDEKSFKIEFIGSFCQICGISDEYQLISYFLGEKGLKTEIAEITKLDNGFIVSFRIV